MMNEIKPNPREANEGLFFKIPGKTSYSLTFTQDCIALTIISLHSNQVSPSFQVLLLLAAIIIITVSGGKIIIMLYTVLI